jgi:hypothetical protein
MVSLISISTNNTAKGHDDGSLWYVKKSVERLVRKKKSQIGSNALVRQKNRILGEENRWYEPRARLSLNFALSPR